jgi:hypothetical protein
MSSAQPATAADLLHRMLMLSRHAAIPLHRAGNVLKQNAISPPPKDPSMASEEEAGRAGRNFVRGALLGVGATFLGVLLAGSPEYITQIVSSVKLPEFLTNPGLIVSLKIAGAAIR